MKKRFNDWTYTQKRRAGMTPAEINADAGNICTFVIGNTRFGQQNISYIKDCPFATAEELEEHVLKEWEENINDWDTVIILGTYAVNEEAVKKYTPLLKGKKILVKGKYDLEDNQIYYDAGFDEVYSYPFIYRDKFILSPVMMRPDNRFRILYSYMRNGDEPIPLMDNFVCVSMEYIQYRPIYFKTLMSKMTAVKEMMLEHRKAAQMVMDSEEGENNA